MQNLINQSLLGQCSVQTYNINVSRLTKDVKVHIIT